MMSIRTVSYTHLDVYKRQEFYNHYDGAMFSLDAVFNQLVIDDEVLNNFIDKLYYPFPYRFDVIPVKVIANIYEEFLGKQLVINGTTLDAVSYTHLDVYKRQGYCRSHQRKSHAAPCPLSEIRASNTGRVRRSKHRPQMRIRTEEFF